MRARPRRAGRTQTTPRSSSILAILAGCDHIVSDYTAWVAQDADDDGYDETVDCDDSDPEVNPGAVEDCDDCIDNDCDKLIDSADPDCA